MSKTFDWNKAVIEKYIFEDGDVTQVSDFIKEQIKLHSLNKISGRVFNPLGFVSNIIDSYSDNPIIEQTLKKLVSEYTNNAGILDTTDGKTFGRVLDNDAEQVYFKDADTFKKAVERRGGDSFIKSSLRSIGNSLINKSAQSLGIDVPMSASKSIMAQTLAYSEDLIKENFFKGSQSEFEELYENEKPSHDQYTTIDPIGKNAIGFTHSELSLVNLNPIKLRRLFNDVKNGLYAQNIAVKKPKVVTDYEEITNISKNIKDRFKSNFNELLGRGDQNNEFWVRRTAEYTPSSKGAKKYDASGTSKIRESETKLFEILLNKKSGVDNVDDLHARMIDEYKESIEGDITEEWVNKKDHRGFTSENEGRTPFEDVSSKPYIEPSKRIEGYRNMYNPNFSKNREIFINNTDRTYEMDMTTLISHIPDEHNDPVLISEIQNITDSDFDEENFMYLSFEDTRTGNLVYLKPYIEGLTDDTQASFDEGDYLGRTESIPKYIKTTSGVNFSFVLHASTPKELMMMYKKIEFLESLNYPIADDQFKRVQNPLVRFSIGDLYQNRGGYITSFSKTISDSDSNWESRKGYTVPKLIRCSISIQKFHDRMPYIPMDYTFDRSADFSLFDMDYTQNE